MEKSVSWTLEDGAITVVYDTAVPTTMKRGKNKNTVVVEPAVDGERIDISDLSGFSVIVRVDVATKRLVVTSQSTPPNNSLPLVQRRIQRLLAERLAWRRRLKLSMRMPRRTFAVPPLPESNRQAAMIRSLGGFNRIARFARYMTHVTPATAILNAIYEWTWQVGVLPLDPGPVQTRAEWQRLVGKELVPDGKADDWLIISQVFSGLCNEGDAVDHVSIRARLMDSIPEFAPRVRSLYWYDEVHDVREMDRLLPILSALGTRDQLVFNPTKEELVLFTDVVAPDLEDGRLRTLVACLVVALLGFSVDDVALALDHVTDEKLQWMWTLAARWIDARTMRELRK